MLIAELFEVADTDTVQEAWLTTVNLLDLLEYSDELRRHFDFAEARSKIARIYSVAERHRIDRTDAYCKCSLSGAEHAILKRKVLRFFRLQVGVLKHFLD